MAEKTAETVETVDNSENAVKAFHELDGAHLVVPPLALEPSKVLRITSMLARVGEMDQDNMPEFLAFTADLFDWMCDNVAVNKIEFNEFFKGRTMYVAEYVMTYAGAVGELLGSDNS